MLLRLASNVVTAASRLAQPRSLISRPVRWLGTDCHSAVGAASKNASEVVELLRSAYGSPVAHTQYDPNVTQLEHALQAAKLAKDEGASAETIAAALVHDLGHLMLNEHNSDPSFLKEDLRHELVACQALALLGFPPAILDAVALHVDAKRFITHKDPSYIQRKLTDATRRSLELQGGPMSAEEAERWEAKPGAWMAADVRRWDDMGKVQGWETPEFDAYLGELREVLEAHEAAEAAAASSVASPEVVAEFKSQGFVLLRGLFRREDIAQLPVWADEVEAMRAGPTPCACSGAAASAPAGEDQTVPRCLRCELPRGVLHHFEHTPDGRRPARSEAWLHRHAHLTRLFRRGRLPLVLERLVGSPMVPFKEKLNYKYPGGGTYAAHQDAPAYPQAKHHVTALVAIDPVTQANGALEFATGGLHRSQQFIGLTKGGIVSPEEEAKMEFVTTTAQPGDVIVFDSYAPHRSGPNTTESARRIFYITYNAASEGDLRSLYYAAKRSDMKTGRVSLIEHWQGKPTE